MNGNDLASELNGFYAVDANTFKKADLGPKKGVTAERRKFSEKLEREVAGLTRYLRRATLSYVASGNVLRRGIQLKHQTVQRCRDLNHVH